MSLELTLTPTEPQELSGISVESSSLAQATGEELAAWEQAFQERAKRERDSSLQVAELAKIAADRGARLRAAEAGFTRGSTALTAGLTQAAANHASAATEIFMGELQASEQLQSLLLKKHLNEQKAHERLETERIALDINLAGERRRLDKELEAEQLYQMIQLYYERIVQESKLANLSEVKAVERDGKRELTIFEMLEEIKRVRDTLGVEFEFDVEVMQQSWLSLMTELGIQFESERIAQAITGGANRQASTDKSTAKLASSVLVGNARLESSSIKGQSRLNSTREEGDAKLEISGTTNQAKLTALNNEQQARIATEEAKLNARLGVLDREHVNEMEALRVINETQLKVSDMLNSTQLQVMQVKGDARSKASSVVRDAEQSTTRQLTGYTGQAALTKAQTRLNNMNERSHAKLNTFVNEANARVAAQDEFGKARLLNLNDLSESDIASQRQLIDARLAVLSDTEGARTSFARSRAEIDLTAKNEILQAKSSAGKLDTLGREYSRTMEMAAATQSRYASMVSNAQVSMSKSRASALNRLNDISTNEVVASENKEQEHISVTYNYPSK